MFRSYAIAVLAAALTCLPSGKAGGDSPLGSDPDESVFVRAKKPYDSASLATYINKLSANDDDLLALPHLIEQLGNDKPRERQEALKRIAGLGRAAAKDLRAAMSHRDPEISRLAAKCLAEIPDELMSIELPAAAIRLIAKRRIPECADLLLRYLPYASDADIEEEIYYLLDVACVVGKQINVKLIDALKDPMPARRAVAGCIVARVGSGNELAMASKLLEDPDAHVRLRTAQGFLARRDSRALKPLIELLDAKPIDIALQAEELLSWVAGDYGPSTLSHFERNFADGLDKVVWSKWYEEKGRHLDPSKIRRWSSQPCLLQIVASGMTASDFSIIGHDGRERWKLPRLDHVLVTSPLNAENSILAGRCIGRDERGELRWELTESTIVGKLLAKFPLPVNLADGRFYQDPRGNVVLLGGNKIIAFQRRSEIVEEKLLIDFRKENERNHVLRPIGMVGGTAIHARGQRGGKECLGIEFRSGSEFSSLRTWKPDSEGFLVDSVRLVRGGKVLVSDGRWWWEVSPEAARKMLPASFDILDTGLDSTYLVDDRRCHRLLWIDERQRILGEIPFSRSIKTHHRVQTVFRLCSFGFGKQPLQTPLRIEPSLDRVALLNSTSPGRQLTAVGQLRQRGQDVFVEVTPRLLRLFADELTWRKRSKPRNVTLMHEIEQLYIDNAAVSRPALARSLYSPMNLQRAASLYLIRMLSTYKQLEINKELAQRIVELSNDQDRAVRYYALFALAGDLKAIDPNRRARILANALSDRFGEFSDNSIAVLAASSIRNLDRADFALIRRELTTALEHESENVTRFVLEGITAQIVKKNASASPFYDRCLDFAKNHPKSIVQCVAVSCLGRIPTMCEKAIPVLVSLIDGDDNTPVDVRVSAITALGEFQTRSKSAIPCLLTRLKKAKSAQERAQIIHTLSAIEVGTPEVLSALEELKDDPDNQVRALAEMTRAKLAGTRKQ